MTIKVGKIQPIKNHTIMKKFIEFLEKNGAWEKFERNFIIQGRNVRDYKRDSKTYKNFHIAGAFTWSETAEGHDYWKELNDKWVQENRSLKEQLLSND